MSLMMNTDYHMECTTTNVIGGMMCLTWNKILLPLVLNTHYISDLIKNLLRGIPKLEKNHTVPFCIHKGT